MTLIEGQYKHCVFFHLHLMTLIDGQYKHCVWCRSYECTLVGGSYYLSFGETDTAAWKTFRLRFWNFKTEGAFVPIHQLANIFWFLIFKSLEFSSFLRRNRLNKHSGIIEFKDELFSANSLKYDKNSNFDNDLVLLQIIASVLLIVSYKPDLEAYWLIIRLTPI